MASDGRYAAIWAEHEALRAQVAQANEALQRAEAALNVAEQRYRQTGDPTARDHHAARVDTLRSQLEEARNQLAEHEFAATRENPQYGAWLDAREPPAPESPEVSRVGLAVDIAGIGAGLLGIETKDLVTDGLAQEQVAFAIENREALAAYATVGTYDQVMGIAEAPAQDVIALQAALAEQRASDYAENKSDILDVQGPTSPKPDAKDINEALAQIQKEDQARIDQAREQRQAETPVAPTRDANEVIAQVERDDKAFHDLERDKQRDREALANAQEQARSALEARTAQLDEARRAELLAAQEKCFAEQRAELAARLEQERQRLLEERARDGR